MITFPAVVHPGVFYWWAEHLGPAILGSIRRNITNFRNLLLKRCSIKKKIIRCFPHKIFPDYETRLRYKLIIAVIFLHFCFQNRWNHGPHSPRLRLWLPALVTSILLAWGRLLL